MRAAAKPHDTFLDLTMHGRVGDILREIAARIDAGTISVDELGVHLQCDTLKLTIAFELAPDDTKLPARR